MADSKANPPGKFRRFFSRSFLSKWLSREVEKFPGGSLASTLTEDIEGSPLDARPGEAIVQATGDGSRADPAQPYLRLTRHLARRDVRRDSDGQEVETDLVSAYTRSIDLLGRQPDLDDLQAWLDREAPISVRVITGQAGAGKTRLALELCERAAKADWQAGFVTLEELTRFAKQGDLDLWDWNAPTLVVVDYAAGQATALSGWLSNLASRGLEPGSTRLRILLLERQADPTGWWQTVFGRGGGDARAVQALLDPSKPVALARLRDPTTQRAILTATLELAGSSERPPEPGSDPAFDQRLAEIAWGGEPLFLMMAGLTAAQAGIGAVLALSRDKLAFEPADSELARIGRAAQAHGVPEPLLIHLAAMTTLRQGLDREAALATVEREKSELHHQGAPDAPKIHAALNSALRHEGGRLQPVQPDMIGEALLLRAWDLESPRAETDSSEAVRRAAEVAHGPVGESVIRTCQDFAIHGHRLPLDWLDVVGVAAADLPTLLSLLNALPDQTVELRERALDLQQKAVDGLRTKGAADVSDKASLATNLNNLSNRLSELGRREDALAESEEAAEIYRALAAERPDAFRPDLAMSLNNLSVRLSELGRREEALAAIEEAVEIRRALAAERPDAFRPDLASSLNNLSNRLSALGRREAALAAIEEAAEIHRALAAERPDAFRPDLAMSLNNLSGRLGDLGRREEALAAIEEAAETYRALAAERPDAFRPDLATSLGAWGQVLRGAERHDQAVAAFAAGIEALTPQFLGLPEAFGQLMGALVREYGQSCGEAELEPDQELLGPVVAKLVEMGVIEPGGDDDGGEGEAS